MIAHGSPSLFGDTVGLVLSCWLLWSDQTTMASGQGLPHSHDSKFTVALENKSVLGPTKVAP